VGVGLDDGAHVFSYPLTMSYLIDFAHVLNGWLFFGWLVLMLIGTVYVIVVTIFRLVYGRWPRHRRGVWDG